jgi:hypothetical protein
MEEKYDHDLTHDCGMAAVDRLHFETARSKWKREEKQKLVQLQSRAEQRKKS